MKMEDKIRMFRDVFAPKSGEKVLFLIDQPSEGVPDFSSWDESREMGREWYQIFQRMGKQDGFSVDLHIFESSGVDNAPIAQDILDKISNSNLVLASMGYSISSSIAPIVRSPGSSTRGAGMQLERIMEGTAFKADYRKVAKYARGVQELLTRAVGAHVLFSTGDELFFDIRHRTALADTGDCTQAGSYINFPSGEGFIAPYEGGADNRGDYSKTKGIWPAQLKDELLKFVVEKNTIVEIRGDGDKAKEMDRFFSENETRRNVAELGIGCNPFAVVTGNIAMDEKVGLHIAYGMNHHFGGTVESDMHHDIVYAKGCPIEGKTVTLLFDDGSEIDLIRDAQLRYDFLEKKGIS